jgi:hypothetical protein
MARSSSRRWSSSCRDYEKQPDITEVIVEKLLFVLVVCGCSAWIHAEIEEARVDVHNGVPQVCGEGGGLNPCRDVSGETFEQELTVDTTPELDSNEQMEHQADRLKHESIEREIEELEGR